MGSRTVKEEKTLHYANIRQAVFESRPNRFIAHVLLDGVPTVCHVKNTGRCAELLRPGARVLVQYCPGPARKTQYDLIAVYKGTRLIHIDSQAPNRIFAEWAQAGCLYKNLTLWKAEQKHGTSRFDFYAEGDGRRAWVEVKGVTLEQDGIARFPDAPTLRGVKHVQELIACAQQGYDAFLVFIIQMQGVDCLQPNWAAQPAFGSALQAAQQAGVHLLALDCTVTESDITACAPVPLCLDAPSP